MRVVPGVRFAEDFESVELDQGGDEPFAFPPGYWLGARPKWRVRERDWFSEDLYARFAIAEVDGQWSGSRLH